ncbi:MAG: hypothetical protein IJP74_05160, partial [Prevotella sp.]|nr:hypothetical protein [Prevotella sp.]
MGKTKINKSGWANTPNAFFVAAMRTTDQRNAEVETENQQWIASRTAFHTAFTTLDEAYQRSLMSFMTKSVAEKVVNMEQRFGSEAPSPAMVAG